MIVVENECVGCPDDLGCIYNACPYYKVVRYICDTCRSEVDDLWYFDGEQLCKDCILNQLEKVEEDDIDEPE